MNVRRTRLVLWATALLVALLWPAPATAAEEIGLSRDGVTWTPDLALPLFEADRRWVPGDDEIRSFQVRNQGPSPANMSIEARSIGGDALLKADIAVAVRVDGGPWEPLDLGVPQQDLTIEPVEVNGVAAVDLRAVFDPASGNETQNLVMPLMLRITLSGDVGVSPGTGVGGVGVEGGGGGDDRDGILPGTGATLGPDLLLAAALLCLLGAVLIVRRSPAEERSDG